MHAVKESTDFARLWVVKATSVWRLGEGTMISSGTLEVGADGAIVLDSTCTDFSLTNVTLKGVSSCYEKSVSHCCMRSQRLLAKDFNCSSYRA